MDVRDPFGAPPRADSQQCGLDAYVSADGASWSFVTAIVHVSTQDVGWFASPVCQGASASDPVAISAERDSCGGLAESAAVQADAGAVTPTCVRLGLGPLAAARGDRRVAVTVNSAAVVARNDQSDRFTVGARGCARRGFTACFDQGLGRALIYGDYLVEGVRTITRRDTVFYGPTVAAQSVGFGAGCPGSVGVPAITSSVPHVGSGRFRIDSLRVRPGAAAALGLALQTQTLSLGGGCTFYLAEPSIVVPLIVSTSAVASALLPIPDDPALRGASLYAQAITVDPQGAFAGLAFSAGLRLRIGD